MSEKKIATAEVPVHEIIAGRWSPYFYAEKPVPAEDLAGIFEAARWAASAFNEQPWRYIVATKDQPEEYDRLLSCLVEANQTWARRAPVLALAVVSLNYAHNGKPNGSAKHDLGLASATLTLEAASRGLQVHQMGGILPDRAADLYRVPEGYQVVTGLAIGYPGDPDEGEGELAERDQTPRKRRPRAEFVFGGRFGEAFGFEE
jgi:nitroreductase